MRAKEPQCKFTKSISVQHSRLKEVSIPGYNTVFVMDKNIR